MFLSVLTKNLNWETFYENVYQTNDFRLKILGNKKVFEKTQIGWRQMLVASHPSRNKFLVIQSSL